MTEHTPSTTASPSRSSPVYRASHDPDGPAALSTTVAHALADCMGVDVTDSNISLYDCVDPDALDSLFGPRHDGTSRGGGSLTVFVYDYRITVHGDGEILIESPTAPR